MPDRFRVQGYTTRNDGSPLFCVCDFGREPVDGRSPIVEDREFNRTFADRADAEYIATWLNENFAADPADTTFQKVLADRK